jgi:integrase
MDRLGNARVMDLDLISLNSYLDKYERSPIRQYMGKDRFKTLDKYPSPRTINGKRSALIAVLKLGVERGYLSGNIANKLPRRSGEGKRERYLTPEEESRLLALARESNWPQMYLLVLMAIDTGARKGELLNLRFEDIDLKSRSAVLLNTKNGKDRKIPLSQSVVAEIEAQQHTSGYLFPSRIKEDSPIDPNRHWLELVERAELGDFHFHDLRHSCASFLLSSGYSLDEIGRLLGHSSAQTTLRYSHLLEARGRELVDAHASRRG